MVPLGPSPYVDVQFGGTKGDATDSPGKFPVTSLENLVGPPHKPPGKFRADKTKTVTFPTSTRWWFGRNRRLCMRSETSSLYKIKTVTFVFYHFFWIKPIDFSSPNHHGFWMSPESCRFLMSVKVVQYVLMPACPAAVINYRRIQVTEQQSEKQKMNLLQKCLIFTHRATELTLEEGTPSTVPQTSAYHIGA